MPKPATVEQYQTVKRLLEEGRLSQAQIGRLVGVSQAYVSKVKLGDAHIPEVDAMAAAQGTVVVLGADNKPMQIIKFTLDAIEWAKLGKLDLTEEGLEAATQQAAKIAEEAVPALEEGLDKRVALINKAALMVTEALRKMRVYLEDKVQQQRADENEKEWRRRQSDPEWLAAEAARDAAREQEKMNRPPPPIEQYKSWAWILEQDATHPAILRYLNEGNDPVLRYAIQMTLGSVEWDKVKEWRSPPYLKAIDSWERQIRLRPHWIAYAQSLSPTEGAANDNSAGIVAQPPQTVDPALEEFLERVAGRSQP